MNHLRKIALPLLFLSLSSCVSTTFAGNRNITDSLFDLEFSYFSGPISSHMNLIHGARLEFDYHLDKGSLNIYVGIQGKSYIYQGNDQVDGNYKIDIEEDGDYSIKVVGKEAKGYISIVKLILY